MLRLKLYCLLFCLAGNSLVSAQVYNYFPVSYSDPETNPSITTSDRHNNYLNLQHQNSFSSANPFSISRISYTKNLERIFCGTALTATNTNFGNHTYNHYALSFAYRNILFNSVYLRIGATYKLVQNNANGNFDYFIYSPSNDLNTKQLSGNVNMNIALASSLERYYFSFSALNLFPQPQNDSLSFFPKYYLFHAGNLASLFKRNKNNSEISFTVFKRTMDSFQQWNFFLNAYFDKAISRKWGMLLGGRIGLAKSSYFQFIPTLSLYSRNFQASVQYSFFVADDIITPILIPTFQMNLNFKL